jgi:uncharacterized cupredoxin-like copper-binding protein
MDARPLRSSALILASLLLVVSVSACSVVAGGSTSWMGPLAGHTGMMAPSGSAGDPGAVGFVAGTVAAPRVVRIIAGLGFRFIPSEVPILAGETITFEVTAMGPAAHEFKVGRLDAVMADAEGVPEIGNIGMMQTASLTYTFAGPGPFGFACHEPGHFEAGMWGTITVVSPG